MGIVIDPSDPSNPSHPPKERSSSRSSLVRRQITPQPEAEDLAPDHPQEQPGPWSRREREPAPAQHYRPSDWEELASPDREGSPRPPVPPQQQRPGPPPRRPEPGGPQQHQGEAPPRRYQEAPRSGSGPEPRQTGRDIVPRVPQPPRPRTIPHEPERSRDLFAAALGSVKTAIGAAAIFSLFTNLLTLAGPLYMLQVYDRVLTSGSVPTLVAMTVLLIVLYGALAILEMLRGQILNRIAGRLDNQLGPATLQALPKHRLATGKSVNDEPLRDLATLRQFISGSGPSTFFDLPWAPIFLLIITVMHWSLGVLTAIGMLVMVVIAVLNEVMTRALTLEGKKASEKATKIAIESGRNLEATVAMGMMDAIITRWQVAQSKADSAMRKAGDRAAAFSSASKVFRMFMQSVLLAAGALLVIEQEISSGMMIAVSIIGGKALGPIGGAVSQWRGMIAAREAYGRLKAFHARYPAEPRRLSLPAPKGRIDVRNLHVTPPGADLPIVKDVSFMLEAGEALAVIGSSAAGKSTLARALIGVWPPDRGSVRLDGADLRMWNRDELGPNLGYLPQTIELFEGTIAQNISRFYQHATPEMIFRAAQRVGVHDMIVDLPDGYNFKVGENGARLSAGQRQRIGLARAVFGDPVLVVLDEPNANLDVHGEAALHKALHALKAARTTVILITHRPSALDAVDRILVMEKGEVRAFGEKSKVMQVLTRNSPGAAKAARVAGAGGGEGAPATGATARLTAAPRKVARKDA